MFQIKFSDSAIKDLKKLDKGMVKLIFHWIEKNLVNCIDPRRHGKALTGNLKGYWRYQVGDYRLFAEIYDDILIIELIKIGHRREIYKQHF